MKQLVRQSRSRIEKSIARQICDSRLLHSGAGITANHVGSIRSRRQQQQQLFRAASFGTKRHRIIDTKKQDNEKDTAAKLASDVSSQGRENEKEQKLPEGVAKSVGIMTGAMFFNNLGFGCVVPVLPLFATSMGLGATGVGTILSTSSLARLLLNIPMGRAADTYGRKPLMVGGGCTVALASIATGMAGSLPTLLASRMLVGTGSSAAGAGTGAYMADITSQLPDQRAKIAGIQNTVVTVAYAVGPAVGGTLCDLYGARSMFFLVGGANAICTMGYFLLPESKSKIDKPSDKTSSSSNDNESLWTVYRELLKDPDRQGLMAMNFGIFCSYSALLTVFPLHAAQVLGDGGTASTIGYLFAGSSLVGFVGAPLGGYLADRFGRKKAIVPAGGLVCLGAALMATVNVDNASMMTLVPPILVWSLGNSMANPGMTAFAADIARDEKTRSQALSLSNSASDLSFLICPISLGALAQLTDCSTALLAAAGIVGSLNLVFALRTTESKRETKVSS